MNKALNFAHKVFGKTNIASAEEISGAFSQKYKLVVFTPLTIVDEICFAMSAAGAGVIGNYTVCSFRIKGVGTFKGGKSSKPKIGQKEKFEMVEEIRLEMICGGENLNGAINAMLKVHTYDEPAYEIYPVLIRDKARLKNIIIVTLKKPVQPKDVLNKINNKLSYGIKIAKANIKNVYINFSGKDLTPGINRNFKPNTTLYITHSNNKEINVRIL